MKKIVFVLLLTALGGGSCVSDKISSHKPENGDKEWNEFAYTTVAQTGVSLAYHTSAEVYFEIYDTAPVRENLDGTGYLKVEGVEPLYAGYTDSNGAFSQSIDLPAYLDEAYIYTPNAFAQTLLKAQRENGMLTASAYEVKDLQPASETRVGYDSSVVASDNWKTWLGAYSHWTGRIKYAYTGDALREKNWTQLYDAAGKVFNTSLSCPTEYRSSNDLYLKKDAEVAVTFLMSNTCWNCSMGYYYYDASTHPTSLEDVNVIMLFPNTQDGHWSNNPELASRYIGVDRGTAVQLMYYPAIASGSQEGATTVFPKGYRIGFVLATNAWGNQLPGFRGSKKYRAATSSGLSVDNAGVSYSAPRTAVYRYSDTEAGLNSVICSFEDFTTDDNFSDIVFTLKSNPVEAVENIPSVEEKPGAQKEVRLLKGIYAFEDLWPSRGDYDMNDVMMRLNYEKTFGQKGIYEESFLLKTYNNFAGLGNGLAFTFSGAVSPADLEFSVLLPPSENDPEPESMPYTPARIEEKAVLLTSDVKLNMGATYKVTARYASPVSEAGAGKFQPFIYRDTDEDITPGKRKEVHLPYEFPTEMIDSKFFGTSDDRSDPAVGRYYVRAEHYPFAIFLAGATESDLKKLLDPANEKTPIDQLFPAYSAWVASGGTSHANWYK